MIIKEKRAVSGQVIFFQGEGNCNGLIMETTSLVLIRKLQAVGLNVPFLGKDKPAIRPWLGFSGGLVVKNPTAKTGDVDQIPGWGRTPGEGNGNPLQQFCLGNPMDRRSLVGYSPWGCKRIGHGQLSNYTTTTICGPEDK